MADRVLTRVELNQRHMFRMDWIDHLAPPVCGLVAVLVPAALALVFLLRGHAAQGAWIFCTTAVALATVFVTKKAVQEIENKRLLAQQPRDPAAR